MKECMIHIEHLRKEFKEASPLTDVCADVYQGDVIAVIGPSGTGKSTLLRCINRLETPTSGRIVVLGQDVTDKATDLGMIRRKMGMVFQSFCLFENLTCLENVMAAPMDLKGISRQEAEATARRLLERVGLSDREDAFPCELSGGQKQRAAIARALAMEPQILLLDEPTSALDPAMVHEVQDVISQLAASGITMLIVTHEMEFARMISNRVFFLCEGVLYEEGSPEQIFTHPQREKTIEFIMQSRCYTEVIDPAHFSMEATMLAMQNFLMRSSMPSGRILKMQALFEELAVVNLLEKRPLRKLKLTVCAGRDSTLCLQYAGEPYDPLKQADEISGRIIRSMAHCSCLYREGRNEVTARLLEKTEKEMARLPKEMEEDPSA